MFVTLAGLLAGLSVKLAAGSPWKQGTWPPETFQKHQRLQAPAGYLTAAALWLAADSPFGAPAIASLHCTDSLFSSCTGAAYPLHVIILT